MTISPDYSDIIYVPHINDLERFKNIIEDRDSDLKNSSNVFSLLGNTWFVKFRDHEWGLFPDMEKFHYIYHLLNSVNADGNDGEHVLHNIDLRSKIKKKEITLGPKGSTSLDDNLTNDQIDDITDNDFTSIKKVGNQLLDELKSAYDSNEKALIKEKQEDLGKFMSFCDLEYGIRCYLSPTKDKLIYKKQYRSTKEFEKLRQMIKNQIRNAIKDIKDRMPELGI